MSSSQFVPSSSRPTVFPPGQKESLKRKYEALSRSKSSSGSSSNSYNGPAITIRETRASFPSPAPKLRLYIKGIPYSSPSLPLWRECLAEAKSIIKQEELDFDKISLDIVKGADEKHSKPTIMIRVPEGTDKSRWRSILITVGQMLHVKNSLELQVMIIEPEVEEHDRAFSIEANDPLMHVWPRIREPIYELIEDMDWVELSACNWGRTRDSAKPTVLIIVEEEIEGAWDEVCRKISGICAASGLPSLQVVVEKGELTGAFKAEDAGHKQGYQSYEEKIPMGHSIGVEEKGAGTLGGYLNLVDPKNPANKTTVFLTKWDNGPRKYGEWPKGISNVVQSPARSDVASRIAYHLAMIETLKDSASWHILESKVRDGTANDDQRNLFASRIQSVKNLQDQVDYLHYIDNKASLRLGQCKMASGYRKAHLANSDEGVKGSYALDWAIGEVARDRIGGNLLPTQDALNQVGGMGRFLLKDNAHCTGISTLHAGLDVFKVARTTGLTAGAIEQLSTYVRVTKPSNSKQKAPIRRTLDTYAVRGLYDTLFNKGGDSGAWILDPRGKLVALLWGCCESSGHGYFTPIQLVIDDIEKSTGKNVEMYQGH